jgi:hypothetical protein
MKIIGIDPGLNGGITCLESMNGKVLLVESIAMPTKDVPYKKKTRKEIDTESVCSFLDRHINASFVFIEKVNAMPGQGVVSMFRFGEGAGILSGIVSAKGFALIYTYPQVWMRAVFGRCSVSLLKRSVKWCEELFPKTDWRKSTRAKKAHDGKTDSCAIAYFGCLMSGNL